MVKVDEYCSIGETAFHLRWMTKREWTIDEVKQEIIRSRLPAYSFLPSDSSAGIVIVSRRLIDGKLVTTPEPTLKTRLVTLLQPEIEQVFNGGQIITDRPAWHFGDSPYRTWGEIEAFRAANHRVIANWETDQGEWMGESDEYFFSRPVEINKFSSLFVPRHTIAELARIELHGRDMQSVAATAAKSVTAGSVAVPVTPSVSSTTHKMRRTSLDAPIDKAIKLAGSLDPGAVYLQLKNLAINEELPFTGSVHGSNLQYTNDKNEVVMLTKDSLGKRLKKRTK